MKCPKCGTTARPLCQNLPNHLCERCDKTLIHYIDPSELLRLIGRAKFQSAVPVGWDFAIAIESYLDGDHEPLKELTGGEE